MFGLVAHILGGHPHPVIVTMRDKKVLYIPTA